MKDGKIERQMKRWKDKRIEIQKDKRTEKDTKINSKKDKKIEEYGIER